MTVQVYWQIDPTQDPSRSEPAARGVTPLFRDVRTAAINRYDYYAQIARAAAQTAFDGVFLGYRPDSDDSRTIAAAIARETPGIALVAEFPASVGSPVYAAKQAVSFQRATGERLHWAIAPDADAATRAREGDTVPEERLDARTADFLTVSRGVHAQHPFSFKSDFFEVENGGFQAPLSGVRFPSVFLQGNHEEALALSARVADVHLFDAAPFAQLQAGIEALDGLAVRAGRSVGFALRQPVLAREDAAEAARDAERLGLDASAIVGDWDAVAAQLADRAAIGIAHFVLSGPASLENAYAIGQHVLPRLRARVGSRRAAA